MCCCMSLTALIHNHRNTIVSSRDLQNVMNIGNELYTSLSRLSKQTEIVCVLESNYHVQYSPSYTGTIHDICTLGALITVLLLKMLYKP